MLHTAEQGDSLSQKDGNDRNVQTVDHPSLKQGADNARAAADPDALPWPALQIGGQFTDILIHKMDVLFCLGRRPVRHHIGGQPPVGPLFPRKLGADLRTCTNREKGAIMGA